MQLLRLGSLYDVETYLHGKSAPQLVCYCRVSSTNGMIVPGPEMADWRANT